MSVNKVDLLGRLGKDPELKYVPGGSPVCEFTLATSENWVDKKGQKQEKTEWHRIVVWGKLAELCNQHLKKGKRAYVDGRLQTRSWDAKDGTKRYITEINAKNVLFIDGFDQSNQAQQPPSQLDKMLDAAKDAYDINKEDPTFTANDIPF